MSLDASDFRIHAPVSLGSAIIACAMSHRRMRQIAIVCVGLSALTALRADPPNQTSVTNGPNTATINQSFQYTFTGYDPDGDITELEIAWNTPNGGTSSITGWFTVNQGSPVSVTQMITFNQGTGPYELWVNAKDSNGEIRDPWAQGISQERRVVQVTGGNSPPTCTVTANPTSIIAGQTVIVSVAGSDTDGNLRYINVDQVSPTNGFYGPGDTGTETPPNNGWYDLGANFYNKTRNLTLTLNNPGTYVFRGAVNDGSGWYYSASNFTVTVSAAGSNPPTAPVALQTGVVTGSGFTAFWNSVSNATGYVLEVSTSNTFNTILASYQGNFTSYPVTGLSSFTTYHYRVRAYNLAGQSPNSNVISVTTTGAVNGTGTGLIAEYFKFTNQTGPVLTRVDSTVNFHWYGGSPAAEVAVDGFSARWSGQVQPRYSQAYTFSTISDDGVRLYIDNQLVIDNWSDHGDTTNTSLPITLVAGQKYDIRMDYYENGGGATAVLQWQSASQPLEVIPSSQLYTISTSGVTQHVYSGTGNVQAGVTEYHLYPPNPSTALPAGTTRALTVGTTDTSAIFRNYTAGGMWSADAGGANGNVDYTFSNTPGYYWAEIFGQDASAGGPYDLYVVFASTAGTPVINSPSTASVSYGNYSANWYQITASNSPTSFSVVNALPQGLNLDPITGIIYGTPAPLSIGSVGVVVKATNAAGDSLPFTVTFTVNKGTQTITGFGPFADRPYGSAPFTITAAASPSGLPVTFSVTSGPASLSGNTVTLTGIGQVTLSATQAGNQFYDPVVTFASFYSTGSGTTITETFTSNGTFNVPSTVGSVTVLIVGGGGGGGWHDGDGGGGGGGGGGVISGSVTVTPGSAIPIVVGAGGIGGTSESGWPTSGGGSSFGNVNTFGGGGGGNWGHDNGWNGGSGGGGTDFQNSAGGSGQPGQGNNGGAGARGSFKAAGGGGGATVVGSPGNAGTGQGGAGGAGLLFNSVVYGSGGGGGTNASIAAASGGSGAGNGGTPGVVATHGVNGRGGGGGGSGNNNGNGGNGGSGVVIVSYSSAPAQAPTISAQPLNQSVMAPNAATFSITASGTPSPTYQWHLSVDNGVSWSPISGAMGASYSTGPTSTGMNGYRYRCVAANSAGSATSNAAALSVTSGAGGDITTGLVGHWKFDEGTGSAAQDSSGFGRHGTLSSPTWATGRIGPGALSFDGDDEVSVAGMSTNGGPITIAFWTNTPNSQISSLFGFDGPDYTQRAQAHVPWNNGILYWDYGNIAVNGRLTANFSAYLGTWTHVTLVSAGSGGNFKAIYINGTLANSSNVSDGASLSTLRIGRFFEGGAAVYHTGTVDDFRVYNRVLTTADVSTLYAYTGASGTAPAITTQPAGATKNVGESVSFTVVAGGSSPLTYQWHKNGAPIAGAAAATYSIASVATTDAGQYSVIVSNAYGTAPSANAELIVNATGGGTIQLLIHRP